MLVGEYWKLLDDAALQSLDGAAIRLLSKSGCRVDHAELLRLLEGAGCRIDGPAMRCYIPEKLIRATLARLGGKAPTAAPFPETWTPQIALHHTGSHPHLLEWPSGKRRLATRQDVTDMAKMAHGLEEFTIIGRVLTCAEADPCIEPLWTTLRIAGITNKTIGGGEIYHAGTIEPLIRMGEVLSGRPGDLSLIAPCDFFIAPLIMERAQADCFLTKRRFGLYNLPGTMPISGMSAPVTLAGTVAVALAELLAGWVLGYAVNPDLPAGGIVATGSLDMKTATTCFGSPEALLQNTAVVQACRRLYNIHVTAAVNYVDCRTPGLDAVFQKMFSLLALPFGVDRIPSDGLLSAGQDYSPVQQILDAEMGNAIDRFKARFEVSHETIALDLIEESITSGRANFLDLDHTLRHFKTEQWMPRWLERGVWREDGSEIDAERKMLERINEYCRDAIRYYVPPDIDKEKLAELQCIYESVEHSLK